MANCKDCIHYEPCFEYGNILDPIHGGVKCDSFKSTADVAPKSEVEELIKSVDDMLDLVCTMTGLELTYYGKYAEFKKKYKEVEGK